MDDSRLANLMFLAGIASLAIPGCGGDGVPGAGPGGGAPGNPLASDNGLTGGDAGDACAAYLAKIIECGGYSDDDYDDYYGASAVPGFSDYCEQYLRDAQNFAGSRCVSAVLEQFVCLSGLSCEALDNDEAACRGTIRAAAAACAGGGGGAEDDGE